MPQKAKHNIHILEKTAMLYKRTSTPHWQVRYKVNNVWLRTTTKKEKLEEARLIAVEIVNEAKYKEKFNLPIITKRFKPIALLAIKRMEEAEENGHGKPTYKRYIQAINKYLIPFFAQHSINKINYALLKQFYAWRINEMKHEPSASAINTHNSAMNRVFDEALTRGFMTKAEVPNLENKGEVSERRADFTNIEYRSLYQYMRTWVREARNGNEKEMRNLLRDYVLILANTGLRAGTETMNLKWRHITFVKHKDKKYLTLNVNGKTGSREIQVRHRVARYLQRIQQRDEDINMLSFNEVIESSLDKYVFRRNSKDMTSNFGKIFARLLEQADLLIDRRNDKKRTLYSLRHYYATQMLTHSLVTAYQLAEYMGTSVGMIKKHYGHLELLMVADKFVGEGSVNSELKLPKIIKKN
jgi:hypothetical protein